MNWPWNELGLPGPSDLAAVRRAYAERLKTTHPEEDPEGFQRLHEAYQQARRAARKGGSPSEPQAPRPEERPSAMDIPQPQEAPQKAEEGWNYEQIFLQEAQRRAEERERQSAERRERFFAKHRPGSEEENRRLEWRFARIEAALTSLEELLDSHAPLRDWVFFLHSGVFFSVKGDEEFVAALEELLRRTPDLEEPVKQEMAQVFGLRKLVVPDVWQGLVEPLTGTAYQAPPPPAPPAPREKKPLHKRWSVRIAALLLLLFVGLPLALRQIEEVRQAPARQAQALMCQYLEEDLGRRMESLQEGRNYENLFSPWDDPNLVFLAWPDGERDLAAGQRGYATNYGNVLLTRALKDFAEQWKWDMIELEEGGVPNIYGGSPGGYFFRAPLWDNEEGVAALGALMESLEGEDWYQTCRPEYTLRLGIYNLAYYTYTSDTPFDAPRLLDYYQNEAGASLCAYIVEESGLAREDFGGAAYELVPQGAVELDRSTCFLVSGVDKATGEAARQYLFEGMYLASLPAEEFSLDMKSIQLHNGDSFQTSWESMPRYIQIIRK